MFDKICTLCGKNFRSRKDIDICVKCRKNTNASYERTCEHCGATFNGSLDTIYCRKCRNKWVVMSAPEIQCESCGEKFKSLYGEKICIKCRHNARVSALLENYTCVTCGKKFKARYKSQVLCDTCREAAGRIPSKCVVCGKEFLPKKRNTVCKTCSRHCQSLYVQNSGMGVKYADDELFNKISSHVAENGLPPSIDILCKEIGITHKVFSNRGITIFDAAKIAGVSTENWLPHLASNFEMFIYSSLREIIPAEEIVLQKTFQDLVGNRSLLRYDFYLPSYNLLIEADGTQHYDKFDTLNTELLEKYDNLKNEYAKKNNINLLRIRYTVLKNYTKQTKQLLRQILPQCLETDTENLFNCWDGSELTKIQISSQASIEEEGSTTIPEGSSPKSGEMGGTLT